MCDGVSSNQPGACPMCGMALERNPAFIETPAPLFTCPMHPEIRQDHSGSCPVCGMALEPLHAAPEAGKENHELNDMTRRFWIGLALTVPVLALAMGGMVPGVRDFVLSLFPTEDIAGCSFAKSSTLGAIHPPRWCFGRLRLFSSAAGVRSSRGT